MQIAGGHPFLPPRQDANAPDLYIPVMAFGTYLVLCSLAMAASKRWSPDSMYGLVSCLVHSSDSRGGNYQSAHTEQRGSHNRAAAGWRTAGSTSRPLAGLLVVARMLLAARAGLQLLAAEAETLLI